MVLVFKDQVADHMVAVCTAAVDGDAIPTIMRDNILIRRRGATDPVSRRAVTDIDAIITIALRISAIAASADAAAFNPVIRNTHIIDVCNSDPIQGEIIDHQTDDFIVR